jgi:hypothetical protein
MNILMELREAAARLGALLRDLLARRPAGFSPALVLLRRRDFRHELAELTRIDSRKVRSAAEAQLPGGASGGHGEALGILTSGARGRASSDDPSPTRAAHGARLS